MKKSLLTLLCAASVASLVIADESPACDQAEQQDERCGCSKPQPQQVKPAPQPNQVNPAPRVADEAPACDQPGHEERCGCSKPKPQQVKPSPRPNQAAPGQRKYAALKSALKNPENRPHLRPSRPQQDDQVPAQERPAGRRAAEATLP